jgi:hypothetical protein
LLSSIVELQEFAAELEKDPLGAEARMLTDDQKLARADLILMVRTEEARIRACMPHGEDPKLMVVGTEHKLSVPEAPEVAAARRRLVAQIDKAISALYGGLPTFTVCRYLGEDVDEHVADVVPFNGHPDTALALAALSDSMGVGDRLFISTVGWV